MNDDLNYTRRMLEAERLLIKQALEESKGNHSQAARLLGMPRPTFLDKLKSHALGRSEEIFKLEKQHDEVMRQIQQFEVQLKGLYSLSKHLESEIDALKGRDGKSVQCANS